jgi:hypothetical protein
MSADRITHKVRERVVSLATTFDANNALADRLRAFGAKLLARRVGTSPRTTEKWMAGDTAPTWKHVSLMLNDVDLCREVLIAAGREDLADAHQTLSRLRQAKELLDGIDLT